MLFSETNLTLNDPLKDDYYLINLEGKQHTKENLKCNKEGKK